MSICPRCGTEFVGDVSIESAMETELTLRLENEKLKLQYERNIAELKHLREQIRATLVNCVPGGVTDTVLRQVLEKLKCTACGGEGKISIKLPDLGFITCAFCKGTGIEGK
jgi:hypothetical protein